MNRDTNTHTTHTQTPLEVILDRVILLSYNLRESNRSFVRASINENINNYLEEKRNKNK